MGLVGGQALDSDELAEGVELAAGNQRLILIDAAGQRIATELSFKPGETRVLRW